MVCWKGYELWNQSNQALFLLRRPNNPTSWFWFPHMQKDPVEMLSNELLTSANYGPKAKWGPPYNFINKSLLKDHCALSLGTAPSQMVLSTFFLFYALLDPLLLQPPPSSWPAPRPSALSLDILLTHQYKQENLSLRLRTCVGQLTSSLSSWRFDTLLTSSGTHINK